MALQLFAYRGNPVIKSIDHNLNLLLAIDKVPVNLELPMCCPWHVDKLNTISKPFNKIPTFGATEYEQTCWRAPRHAVHVQLFVTCWEKLLQVFRFVYLCLGRVRVGFVAGALVRSGLFWPCGTLSLDLLGLLRPIGRTVGLGQGYCALGSVFRLCCWALLVDPLNFVRNSTSGHCCPSRHFVQGWTTLGDLP